MYMLNAKLISSGAGITRSYEKDKAAAQALIKKICHYDLTYVRLVDLLASLLEQKEQGFLLTSLFNPLVKFLKSETRLLHFVSNVEDLNKLISIACADVTSLDERFMLAPLEWRSNNKPKYFEFISYILREKSAELPALQCIMRELAALLQDIKQCNSFSLSVPGAARPACVQPRLKSGGISRNIGVQEKEQLDQELWALSDLRGVVRRMELVRKLNTNGHSFEAMSGYVKVFFSKNPERFKYFLQYNSMFITLVRSILIDDVEPHDQGQFRGYHKLYIELKTLSEGEQKDVLVWVDRLDKLLEESKRTCS